MFVETYQNLFPALITGKQSVSGSSTSGAPLIAYTFVEQSFDPDTGVFIESDSPREGTCFEVNDEDVDVGFYAWVRLRGIVGGEPTGSSSAAAAVAVRRPAVKATQAADQRVGPVPKAVQGVGPSLAPVVMGREVVVAIVGAVVAATASVATSIAGDTPAMGGTCRRIRLS